MRITVSIVEDDTSYREHLVALIGGTDGFRVTGAHATAEIALKKIPFEKPDVIVVDLELPGLSGVELIRALKTKIPSVEILIVTIHAESEYLFNALEAGASGYLMKPAAPARVIEAIRDVHVRRSPVSRSILTRLKVWSPWKTMFCIVNTDHFSLQRIFSQVLPSVNPCRAGKEMPEHFFRFFLRSIGLL